MPCKLKHADPDGIPEFLCRQCHPELIPTAAENAAFFDALRQSQVVEQEKLRREREIARLREKITNMMKREPEPDSVAGKILAGFQRKLARLELGE